MRVFKHCHTSGIARLRNIMLIDIRRLYDQNCCGSDFFPKGRDAFCSHRDLWDKSEGEPALVLADTHYACSETVTVEFERMRSIRIETRIFCFHFLFSYRTSRVWSPLTENTRALRTTLLSLNEFQS